MDIALTPEQQDIIGHAVATGRVAAPEDAVREALDLWVERERRRSEILTVVDEAEAALARGEGMSVAVAGISELIADVQSRGRERLGSG
jgi:Arc/MetJ-type ribon-helix-helix transcriptional regulator